MLDFTNPTRRELYTAQQEHVAGRVGVTVRNLIGRLNARSSIDLDRIATAWQVPVSASDKASQVGQLYRALTDPRTIRDAWETLDDDDRALIATLVAAAEAIPLDALARQLNREPADVRDHASRLYRAGWIAREGDDDELRVGEAPRLFIPRELANLVNRVEDEITTGDLSSTPLGTLLALLDDVELEETAKLWGIQVIPGLRSRDELVDAILEAVAEPERHKTVEKSLGRDAAAILNELRGCPPEGITLESAVAATKIDRARPGGAQRFRTALAQLEAALLAWHTYHRDGSRWLFMPSDIRTPRPRPETPVPESIVLDEPIPPSPYRYELAWDLLTLLRALTDADRPRNRLGDPFPAPWLRRLNARIWHAGREEPPAGYVPFLMSLALAEGLLAPEQGRSGTPVVTGEVRRWRDRTFADQDAHLRWRWLTATTWIEGSEQAEAHVWGGDWRALRRGLLTALGGVPDNEWRPLDAVAGWIAGRSSTLLGRTFTAAIGQGAAEDGPEGRRAATIAAVELTLRRAFVWFGLVEVRRAAAHGYLMRLTPRGRAISTGGVLPEDEPPTPLDIRDDGTIALERPSPLQIWSVSAFADPGTLDMPATYRLSARSIERAIGAGFQTAQIGSFLRSQSNQTVPAPVAAMLDQERRDHPVVRLTQATLLAPASAEARDRLRALLSASGIESTLVGDKLLVTAETADARRLVAILRSSGFVTLAEGAPGSPQR
jgi:hypothetical protein